MSGDWNFSYGLPRFVCAAWPLAYSARIPFRSGLVQVRYTGRGWCALLVEAGRIDRWTDANAGIAGVGTCTDAGKARCLAAAEQAVIDLQKRKRAEVSADAWLRRQLEGLGK
jgi:hypothetical protein